MNIKNLYFVLFLGLSSLNNAFQGNDFDVALFISDQEYRIALADFLVDKYLDLGYTSGDAVIKAAKDFKDLDNEVNRAWREVLKEKNTNRFKPYIDTSFLKDEEPGNFDPKGFRHNYPYIWFMDRFISANPITSATLTTGIAASVLAYFYYRYYQQSKEKEEKQEDKKE